MLRTEYPGHSVRAALQKQLPPEANPAAGARGRAAAGWESGEGLDRESSDPAWTDAWSGRRAGKTPIRPRTAPQPTDDS